jgi:hypothetical protein
MFADRAYSRGSLASPDRLASLLYFAAAVPTVGFIHLVTDGIGGSPYGPGTLAGTDGSRQPVEAELTTARNLGGRLARVAGRLKDLRVSRASAP